MSDDPTTRQGTVGLEKLGPGGAIPLADGPTKNLVTEFVAEPLAAAELLGLLAAKVGESGQRECPDVHPIPRLRIWHATRRRPTRVPGAKSGKRIDTARPTVFWGMIHRRADA